MGKLIRGTALDDQVKFCFALSTDIVNVAIEKHDLYPSSASVLGKAMTIALMMGGNVKDDACLTIKIDGGGPIGQVVCDCNGYGTVRGYVTNPHVNFTRQGKLDEITTLGNNGFIDVIKDLKIGDLFTSSVAMQTGNLAYDFAYYYNKSEQTPTSILLGAIINPDNRCQVCGGMLIQLMPDALEETITFLEKRIDSIKDFSNLINTTEDYNEILELFFDKNYKVLGERETLFFCPCEKGRFAKGLLTIEADELKEMIKEGKGAEIVCHYCNKVYNFNTKELQDILDVKLQEQNKKTQ